MSEVRRTTYQVRADGAMSFLLVLLVFALVLLALVWGANQAAIQWAGFDGMIGSGCDAGNPHCTFQEWRKGCSSEDARAHVCNHDEYVRQGGR